MNKVKTTPKQKAFIKAKLANPTISNYQAAIKAGYSENTATNVTGNVLEKRGLQALVEKLAKDDTLALKLNEGLESFKVDITGAPSPDFKTRLDYIKEFLNLKGYRQENTPNVAIQVNTLVENDRKDFE